MALLNVENLIIGYSHPLSSEINFDLDRGDVLLIRGRNGSGKSTLIKTILKLIKAKSGSLHYSQSLEQKGIAYLSQQNLVDKDFPITVEEMLISALSVRLKFFDIFRRKKKLAKDLSILSEKLELGSLLKMNFSELSVGQKQRVLFARALAINSDLLILDELTASVDSVSRDYIKQILWELKRERKIAMIIVSHDADFDYSLANKVLILKDDGSNELIAEDVSHKKSENLSRGITREKCQAKQVGGNN